MNVHHIWVMIKKPKDPANEFEPGWNTHMHVFNREQDLNAHMERFESDSPDWDYEIVQVETVEFHNVWMVNATDIP